MEVRRSRTCEKCKAAVPISEVRLFPRDGDRNWILCEACCDYLKNRSSADVRKPVTNQPKPVQAVNNSVVKPSLGAVKPSVGATKPILGVTNTVSKGSSGVNNPLVNSHISGIKNTVNVVSEVPEKAKPTYFGTAPKNVVKNVIKLTPGQEAVVKKEPEAVPKVSKVTNKVGEKVKHENATYTKEEMFCGRCKYSFTIDPSRVGVYSKLTCPYCGKIDHIYDRKSGAQVKEDVPTMMKSLLYKKP